jgi:beta-glucosidase-like glycosyl hydrolase/CubicO group peptidase (beta-lactamase class C family)
MVAAYSNREKEHTEQIKALIREYNIGGLIFFQGGPVRQAMLTNEYQSLSKVPLLIAMDAEWGVGMRLDSTLRYPYQMALGAVEDNRLIYQMGTDIANQFHRIGMHINFAPVIDVNNNAKNPVINFRSFGEIKDQVTAKGLAYMHGMQDHGILACGKHFPGHGDTDVDSHQDLPIINHTLARLNEIELYPFRKLIEEGLGSIMVAHLSIPSLDPTPLQPSTLSRAIVTGLLKDSLGFEGIVFTDALNMEGVAKYYEPGEVDLNAFLAGNDVLLYSLDVPRGISLIFKAVNDGRIDIKTLDNRVRKIISLKYWAGLNDPKTVDIRKLTDDLNSPENIALLRKLVAASFTLIKNERYLIPLKRIDTLRVASVTIGESHNDIFHERMDDYSQIDHLFLKDGESYRALQTKLSKYNLLILNFTDLSQYASRNFGLSENSLMNINQILQNHPSIIVWNGNPYGIDKIENADQALSILVTYQESHYTKDLSVQALFGAIGLSGKLPVTINEKFPAGTGLVTEGNLRLGYAIPEEEGLDGSRIEHGIDSLATYALREGVAPGLQVLVARNQKVVFHKTYGYHTYDSLQKVQKDDLYDFASVTKVTSALPALMQLYDQQKFDLDATLGDYLPYFHRGNKKEITIRRILSHNAGLQSWIAYWQTTLRKNGKYKFNTLSNDSSERYPIKLTNNLFQYKNYKKKIYRMIRKSPVNPDQGYVYSGLSFYLWPEIVENLTGMGFEKYLKDSIYHILGAYTLTYNPFKHYDLDRIIPTENDTFFRKVQIHGMVHDEGAAMMDGVSGNAGLFGTATDLAKLMQMYLNMGEYGGYQFISRPTMKNFTAYHYANENVHRGLGFDKPLLKDKEQGMPAKDAGEDSFGHSGYTGTFTWADPDTGILFVFMSNRVYPTRENNKIASLSIRPKMHQVIYDARMK